MALTPPKQSVSRKPIKAGVNLAVCTAIIEIGTQVVPKYQCPGEVDEKYQVMLTFDFPKDRIDIEENGKMVSRPKRKTPFPYTFSYHKKSKLGGMLTTWIGSTPKNDFDLFQMLGKPAMITIGHDHGDEGQLYDNIVAVTQLMDGMDAPKAECDLVRYSMSENGRNIPDGVPDWIAAKIKESKEWGMLSDAASKMDTQTRQDDPIIEPEPSGYGVDDDIPF